MSPFLSGNNALNATSKMAVGGSDNESADDADSVAAMRTPVNLSQTDDSFTPTSNSNEPKKVKTSPSKKSGATQSKNTSPTKGAKQRTTPVKGKSGGNVKK